MEFVQESMINKLSPFENPHKEEDLEQVSESTIEAGYETSNPIYNTVDAQVFLVIILCILPLLKLFTCSFKESEKIRTVTSQIQKQIYWNAFIRLFIEEY